MEGQKIVWVDHRNGPGDRWQPRNGDIYLHDLATGVEVRLTDLKTMPVQWPRVDSGRVFFVGGDRLYMIDLAKR